MQKAQPLEEIDAGRVAARSGKAGDKTEPDALAASAADALPVVLMTANF